MTKSPNRCFVCQKEAGTSYCTGCGVYFCTRDFKSHRGFLFSEMETLITHHNDLQDKINNSIQHSESHSPLFAQIDEWEKTMTEKIKVVAEHARDQLAELLNSKRVKLDKDFKKFSQELVQLKQSENYVEHDLTRLKYLMHQFNQNLKHLTKPLTIVLHTELSDRLIWSRLIYPEEKSTYVGIQKRQQQVKEEQQLATLLGEKLPPVNGSSSARCLIKLINRDFLC